MELDSKWLWERPIPCDKHLRALEQDFGQMWLDGAQSIIDPRFNDGRERLPLWMVGFWREMANIVRDQDNGNTVFDGWRTRRREGASRERRSI